ncbi:MAG: type II and III secretion system protein [Cyanobacteriota bacterium]|nr:type II and III secretion system protein [Cyanobacteriota bacterium]
MVSADGNSLILSFSAPAQASLQLARPNLTLPGRLPQAAYAPPLQPRAVAPPLGDMAVGTMVIKNRSYLELSGPPVTMTTRGARARDVLMALARMGGYGFTYVEDYAVVQAGATQGGTSGPSSQSGGRGNTTEAAAFDLGSSFQRRALSDKDISLTPSPPVSVSFSSERFDRAFNFVLLAANLQGRLEGRTILVGKRVQGQNLGPQLSKVYRLNQVDPNSAADYLANLGAQVTKTNTIRTAVTQGATDSQAIRGTPAASTTQEQTQTEVVSYGASQGPLIGLNATTDTRLRTITLIGEPSLISVAETYLKQLDLRQRQVALSVRILDVSLSNDSDISNSFAFRYGNMFVVNNQGQLLANFGNLKPPGSDQGGLPGDFTGATGTSPLPGVGRLSGVESGFIDSPNARTPFAGGGSVIPRQTTVPPDPLGLGVDPVTGQTFFARPGFGPYNNPTQPGVTEIDSEGKITYKNPTQFRYPANQLFDFVRASIESGNTKVLASPTLIIQEGDSSPSDAGSDSSRISADGKIGRSRNNEGFVRVGTQFVTSYEVRQDVNGNNFCQPAFSNAGLTFGARVETIDDNGFVTFSLSPEISAPVGTQNVGNCGEITLINDRLLDTGRVRVRDGQTLILTGVISETDRQAVTKWPILGDMPLIGQFFRRSSSNRSKNELVILVTPRIINDDQGGVYGYGWQPSTRQSREFMGSQQP